MNELPHSWAEVAIADVTTPFMSIDPAKTPERAYRYVDIGSIDNKTQTITDPKSFLGRDAPSRARRLIRTGDTLFSTVRTYLKNIAMVPEELDGELTSTGIAVLRPSDAVDAAYLFRWACSDDFVGGLSSAQDGTMYPAVSDRDVIAASIPLPPLPEQRRIVAKINSLTGKSRRARDHLDHIPRLVEKYKQAVLAAAFRGDLTREWRELAGNPSSLSLVSELRGNALTKRLSSAATRNLVNQAIIPASWGMFRMEEICRAVVDGTHHTPTYVEYGIPFISVKDVRGGSVDFSDTKMIAEAEHEKLAKRCRPRLNDVLITKSGTIGRCAVVTTDQAFSLFVSVAMVRPATRGLRPHYLKYALEYWVSTIDIGSEITGTAVKNLHLQDIKALGVPVPSTEEQDQLILRLDSAMSWIDRLASEATSARRLIDRLDQAVLAKAFRGELVPQDPADEPASGLLDRIRAERTAAPKPARGRKGKVA